MSNRCCENTVNLFELLIHNCAMDRIGFEFYTNTINLPALTVAPPPLALSHSFRSFPSCSVDVIVFSSSHRSGWDCLSRWNEARGRHSPTPTKRNEREYRIKDNSNMKCVRVCGWLYGCSCLVWCGVCVYVGVGVVGGLVLE